jgi:hypothetical protein
MSQEVATPRAGLQLQCLSALVDRKIVCTLLSPEDPAQALEKSRSVPIMFPSPDGGIAQ